MFNKMMLIRREVIRSLRRKYCTTPLILGIETSCDDTGASVMRGNTVLSDVVNSQQNIHLRFVRSSGNTLLSSFLTYSSSTTDTEV